MVEIMTYTWVALRGTVRPKKGQREGEPRKYEKRRNENMQRVSSQAEC